MGRKKAFTAQSLLLCLLFNGLLLAGLYWMARQAFLDIHDGVALVTGGGLEGVLSVLTRLLVPPMLPSTADRLFSSPLSCAENG